MSSLLDAAVAHVIAAEADKECLGTVIVVKGKRLHRSSLVRRITRHFLEGGYDPDTEDPPTALVCARKQDAIDELMRDVNRGLLQRQRGKLLTSNTRPHQVGALTFATYSAIQHNDRLKANAFDFLVVHGVTPNELDRYRATLERLDTAFTVLIVTHSMYEQGELEHWPQLGEPHLAWPPPPDEQQPATPAT